MEFKRGRKADTDVMIRMQWESRCGQYRVSRVECKFSSAADHYSAEKKLPATGVWWPIEWHHNRKQNHTFKKYRSRRAAELVCDKDSERKDR